MNISLKDATDPLVRISNTQKKGIMMDSKEIRVMRFMAWERVKGEMEAILAAFWDDDEGENYKKLHKLFHDFMDKIDNDSPLA